MSLSSPASKAAPVRPGACVSAPAQSCPDPDHGQEDLLHRGDDGKRPGCEGSWVVLGCQGPFQRLSLTSLCLRPKRICSKNSRSFPPASSNYSAG